MVRDTAAFVKNASPVPSPRKFNRPSRFLWSWSISREDSRNLYSNFGPSRLELEGESSRAWPSWTFSHVTSGLDQFQMSARRQFFFCWWKIGSRLNGIASLGWRANLNDKVVCNWAFMLGIARLQTFPFNSGLLPAEIRMICSYRNGVFQSNVRRKGLPRLR